MGKFDRVLLVSDLDFTFLGAKGRVVPRNLEALARFFAEGGKFTIATGRAFVNAEGAIPGLRQMINAPAITANGACLYDAGEDRVLAESLMDFDRGYEVVRYLRGRYPEIGLRVTTDKGLLTDYVSPLLYTDFKPSKPIAKRVLPLDEWKPEKWYKVCCRDTHEGCEKIRDALAERYDGVFDTCFSEETIFEFHAKGANKAAYLGRLRDYYRARGVEPIVFALGDYENDVEMLESADVAVCPANALDSVKKICDFCLCDHKDGVVADLVELLEREGIDALIGR